jgi:hypothetical protein
MPPPQTIQAAAFNLSLKKVPCHMTLLLQSSPLHFGGFEMPHQLPIPESTTSYHSGVMVFSLLYFQYQHGLLGLCRNICICNIIIFHLANTAIQLLVLNSLACSPLVGFVSFFFWCQFDVLVVQPFQSRHIGSLFFASLKLVSPKWFISKIFLTYLETITVLRSLVILWLFCRPNGIAWCLTQHNNG